MQFVKSVVSLDGLPKDRKPHIAFAGRSNVGKSSLINHLANQKGLARSSKTPGRTQMINLFDAGAYYLADLPGYGYAKTSKGKRKIFAELIRDYLWDVPEVALVIVIVDARIGATELDQEMIEHLKGSEIPFIIVANKVDKLSTSQARVAIKTLEEQYPSAVIIPHSAVKKIGKREIEREIKQGVERGA